LRPFQQAADLTWLPEFPAKHDQADAIVVLGGDGTIHRHLAQLVDLQLPVLIVPRGSGNDFARALGLRRVGDALAAWRQFTAGKGIVQRIDLGTIRPVEKSAAGGTPAQMHYFCTVAGIGLDGEIARRANRLPRWLRARGGYALSLIPAVFWFSPVSVKITVRDSVRESRIFLAAFANTPAYGGGMKIAPQARFDDGKLDICIVREVDKLKLFCLFPTVYFGRHLQVPEVDYFQTPSLKVEAESPLEVFADGEFLCRTPIEVGVAEGVLPVILPPR
jgi:diacylglycerol kinase (ATP)